MKPKSHKETHTAIEETPSNNRDTNKKQNRDCGLKAGLPKHGTRWARAKDKNPMLRELG
jgi:hypothetical protein